MKELAFLFAFLYRKIARFIWAIILFLNVNSYAQKASIVENITESEGLNTNYVFQVCEDDKGIIWLGTDKGLVKFDNGNWKVFDTDNGIPGNYINAILPAKNGLFLYLSEKGFFFFDTQINKITCNYNVNALQFVFLEKSEIQPNYILYGNDQKLFAVENSQINKSIALGEDVIGFYLLKNKNKVYLKKKNIQTLKKPLVFKNHEIQIENGIGIIRKANGKILDTISTKNGLESNLVQSAFKSKGGDLYVTTLGGGISILKNKNAKTIFPMENQKIRQIDYQNGKYYLLSEGFLYVLNDKKILQKFFLMKDALSFLLREQDLFVGSFSGLSRYKLGKNNIQLLSHKTMGAGISKILSNHNHIYYSTYGTGIFDENMKNISVELKYPFRNVENFFKIENGYALNSYQSGFFRVDEEFLVRQWFTKKEGLLSNYVSYIFSKANLLFVGTKFGLSVFKNNKIWKNYNEQAGFVGSLVREIFEDNQGQIWVVSDKTIMKLKDEQLISFGSFNSIGQQNDLISKSFFVKEKNQLCIASKNKFSLIDLDAIVPDKSPEPPILLQGFANGKKLKQSNHLELLNDNFNIEFQFESVYKNPISIAHMYYKLNNEDWKRFPEPQSLKFSHLEIGNHSIQIKTVNADGYENHLKTPITIEVLDHFYKRWWFIVLSILLFLGTIAYYINQVNKRKYIKKLADLKLQQELELERKRISRDLHDNIGAYTTSLIAKVDDLSIKTEDPYKNEKLLDLRENAENILGLLRQTIWILQNKETNLESFYDTFKNYANKYLHSHEIIKINFHENIVENRKLDSSSALHLFRILQEALQNIVKHSQATEVNMKVESEKKIVFLLQDNGKGFDNTMENIGNGLRNMQERSMEIGYHFSVQSGKNKGTEISVVEM